MGYTGTGYCYNPATTACSGKAQPGTRALRTVLQAHFQTGDLGIYNCRNTAGGAPSTHRDGRAWDAALNWYDLEQRARADRMVGFLIRQAARLGIQRVIWNRQEWDVREGWEPYSRTPHRDHIHVEMCVVSSRNLTEADVRRALAVDPYERPKPPAPTPTPAPAPEEAPMAGIMFFGPSGQHIYAHDGGGGASSNTGRHVGTAEEFHALAKLWRLEGAQLPRLTAKELARVVADTEIIDADR